MTMYRTACRAKNNLSDEAHKALRKHSGINPREIFDDPDPLLVECVKWLLEEDFKLAEACKAAVALKREFDE